MPDCEVEFELDEATFKKILRAAGALGHEKMTITAGDGGVNLTVIDSTDSTSNAFEIQVPGTFEQDKFNFVVNISNLKLISGDYNVRVSSKLISNFKNRNVDVEYFIALEKSSTYGE
jgi:hypothetical protein